MALPLPKGTPSSGMLDANEALEIKIRKQQSSTKLHKAAVTAGMVTSSKWKCQYASILKCKVSSDPHKAKAAKSRPGRLTQIRWDWSHSNLRRSPGEKSPGTPLREQGDQLHLTSLWVNLDSQNAEVTIVNYSILWWLVISQYPKKTKNTSIS